MMKRHENYKELIWSLAKTDFKLRYHGSFLGYIWALLKPLLTFLILMFVFSSIFNVRNMGIEHYGLQLLTAIMVFNFFSEGTTAGLNSLMNKSQLVTKIYVPRWTIIVASTLNSVMIFGMNLVVIIAFFAWDRFFPGWVGIAAFIYYIILTYTMIISFSLIFAPLYLKFRDLGQIWDVILQALFYASPIVYPLSIIPQKYHAIILANPIGFIIHYTKMAMTENHFASLPQLALFTGLIVGGFVFSIWCYRKQEAKIAEYI
jgi:ABC-type polysaccharide/polyol phosphate export permease